MKQEENIRELAISILKDAYQELTKRICSNISNRWKVAMAGSSMGERMDESPEYRFGDRC